MQFTNKRYLLWVHSYEFVNFALLFFYAYEISTVTLQKFWHEIDIALQQSLEFNSYYQMEHMSLSLAQ